MANRTLLLHLCLTLLLVAAGPQANGQEADPPSGYRSQIDENLTIRKGSLVSVTDNVGGIYSRPIETQLHKLLQENPHLSAVDSNAATAPTMEELEESPTKVQELGKAIGADALLSAKITKGPRGISITLDLFLVNDGKLLLQETLRDHPRFELPELQEKTQTLLQKLISHMPYNGLILSRNGTKVTISLGRRDGAQTGQVVNAILLLQVQRHPKFNFLISSEKEVLGRIRLTKVEDTLSFGQILSEKDKGSIRKMTKVSGLDSVQYPDDTPAATVDPAGSNANNADHNEWVPIHTPTFGLVGFRVGVGTYAHKSALPSEGIEGRSDLSPSLAMSGELWLNPRMILRANLRQGIVNFKNPRSGSSPDDLSVATSNYEFFFGYNFLMHDDFWGPKITLLGGVTEYKAAVDNTQPMAFTSTSYSGITLAIEGVLPLEDRRIWAIGAGLNFMFQPTLNESPVSSGDSSKNTVNQFYLFTRKKIGENIQAIGRIDLESYSTAFTGSGTRGEDVSTDSQTLTTISGGINYLF